ncbi:hypothetical protein AVEN_190775-1 [Araneus ventricosus]|uniref:DUF4817 domain-containing protein n=1 Tax=Araneus ventricosus TaxID=182803 RepID=A0A4Y2L9B9_ARAVE|nr:hypothetical protein AVEN_190775-1 [Araneus ventricosus]
MKRAYVEAGVKKMISKFEKIGELGPLQGKGRKRLSTKLRKKSLLPWSKERPVPNKSSPRTVSIDWSLPWSTLRKALRIHTKVVQAMNPANPEKLIQLAGFFVQNNR